MATEAESELAESLSLTKREGEDKDPISRQLDKTVDEYCCPGELKKVEGGHNEPPETVEDSANSDTMQAAIPIGDETVSTIIEGNVETLEGESFLESPSVANIASEKTCRVSEHHWADEKPNQTEKEIPENEIQLQKDQKFEDLEETGCEKNKAVEETKERAEKVNDSIDIVSVIERGLEKTKTEEPALKVEEEETLKKQLILDQNVKIIAKRQASIEREPLSIEEAIRPPLILLKDMTPIKDEIQDKNNLDTPFVIQTEEMCLQKEEKPEIFKEVSEIGSEGVVKESPKEVEEQTKIPEKTAQADSTTPEKGKGDESPEQKVDDSFIQREESKQIKSEGLAMTEASAVENRNEDKFTVVVTEENISNTEIAGAEEHMIKETSKYEEDPEQSFLQHNEPKKEKLERSSNVISESENAETITCLKEERSINNLEESFEEKGREDKPTDTDDISEHVIPTEKNFPPVLQNFPPVDLNEKIDSAEVEIPEKNVNALHVTHSLVEETEQVERENVDAVSKFEPQEEVNEANGASTDEEKQIEKASEPCKITESTTSEHTSKEVVATKELISSKIDAEKLQKINGLDSEEKIEVGDAGENIEEETQKNEEAFAADMHKITTSDDTQEGIIEEDAPVKDYSNVGSADETVEQSFQVESLDDAAPELINNSNKVEDDVERNSTIDEEVHDIPKTTGEGEITKEYNIEGNVRQSEKIKDEKDEEQQIPPDGIRDVSISTITANPEMQNDDKAILEIGEGAKDKLDTPPLTLAKDMTPIEYEIQDKNNLDTPCVIQTEEMCFQKGEKPEIFNEFSEIGSEDVVKENPEEVEDQTEIPEKTTQADSPMSEKGKDDENPEQKVDGSFIKHEESKQIKIEGLIMTEASARENRNEDEFTVIEAEKEINNTEISKADEHRRNETSIHKEDPEQSFLQHDDPKEEKLERSLNVNSEKTEVAAPSENVETITCVQEGSSTNNLEESFEEKEKEDKPTDTNEISEHGILREKNFQPIDLNEKIESAEIEIPEKNVNDSHVKRSLEGETEPMECEKHDEVSKFQPQEVNEANEASTEEVKQIEEASEGCKSTERTALGHTSTEEAATKELISSEKDAEELQKIYGLDSEEKLEVEDAGENIEEETQKNEEAFDTEMHKRTTKSDDPEKCTITEDAPVKFFSTVGAGDETVEQSFQVESFEEAAPELNSDNKAYKEEDDVERNNLIDEEVHDGPTTTSTGELTEGHILESDVRPSKKIEEEKDEGKQIPHDGINPEIQNDEEEILEIGEGAKDKVDCPLPTLLKENTSVEDEVQDKNNLDSPLVIETEEMYLQKPQKPEILKEVSESGPEDVVNESPKPKEVEDQTEILEKTAQADSTTNEKGKDDEIPEQKLAGSFIEQRFLQHSEPKNEKLETSLNVISEMMETATSSENAETITCVKDEISIKNLEQSFEEKGKEDKPTDTDDIREHGIPIEKLDLNEKTESAEVEIPERKVNDLHITHLLVEETEQVECGKLEEVSKFQPQEEFNEANGASTEEEKPIEEASEACKSTERTTLEHLSTEETKKNEVLDTDMHQISMKIDDTEKGIIEEDAPTEVCRAVGVGDETVEQSFQGERLEEAAPELNGDNTSYKVEDNVERNSIVDEEVHGGPMITGKGDVTKEHMIEGNVRYITPELIEEETTKSFQDNETKAEGSKGEDTGEDTKKQIIEEGNVIDLSPESVAEGPVKNFQDDEKEAEKSKEEIVEEGNVIELSPESVAEGPVKNFQDDEKEAEKSKEEIVEEGNVIDLSPESVAEDPVKNFQDDEKEEEKFKEEIFEDSETAEPGEGIACETIQDDEIPGRKIYPSSVKQVERLQGEEDLSPMIASGEEKRDEDGSFVMVTGDEDNITRLVNAKENTEKETPKDDEDAKQISQQDEPGEKLERSLIVMSEETEEGVTSEDAGKFTRMGEEADVRNLEETLEEEIKEAAKHTDDTKEIGIAKEEDLELVAEESGASKSTESTDLELNSKESETEVEELINGCKLDSKEELEDRDASKNIGEETKNEETSDLSLHKVETENASAEKSMKDVDGTVKDSSTVCIGEEVVELNCPEDENAQKSMEEAEPKSNGGDQSCKTDNETQNLKNKFVNEEVYEGPRVTSMGEDIEEHIIQKEHTATDIIPESTGEDIFKSSEEDEKEEEKSKVEGFEIIQTVNGSEDTRKQITEEESVIKDEFEAFETISAGQNTREQIMEIDSLTDHPPESTEKETLEKSPKEDKVCEEFETTASSTTTTKQNIEECATPDLSSLSVGEETIRESSEEDGNKSDEIKLTEEVKSYKAEDDAEWNNIIEKKVHDEPKIPITEEVITEDTIDSNVQYISPEFTKDETVESFQDNEKEEERSKGEDTKEKIIGKGNVIDVSPEFIAEGPVKNFEDNGKVAEKFKGELEEESETAEAVMNIAREIYKDDESSERIFHASSSVKQEERLQGEGEDLSPTKASEGEKREVDKSTIMDTGDEDNITNLVKVEENSENKTSKDDEDAKQILQKDEPVEKLERSINVMTEETEEGFPSVNVEKLTCMKEEASVQNLQETMEIEIKEEVKDTHDTEDNGIAKEEAHDGPKIAGMGEDTEKHILQEHTVRDISPESIGEETSKSPKEDDKVEEKPRVETCEELVTTTGGEGTEKQNLEEEYPVKNQSTVSVNVETNEESSKEDDMVVKIPKQEGCEIIQTADGGEDMGKQIMEEDTAVRDNFELKVFEKTGAGQDTREQIINKIDSVEDQSPESIEKETLGASSKEDEEGEGFKTTASSMKTEKQNKEECATPHVSLLSVDEETAIESSNGGESDAIKLKEEVKESYLEFIQQTEARSFMDETKSEVLKDRENINKDLEEEMPPKETNENLVEHSLVSEASEKENKTETSEKEESTVNDSDSALVTIVTDEKCLRDAETEDKKQNLESDDLGKKLECTSESVAEDQRNKPLPEISQTQIEEDNDEGQDQTIESVANESIKDVILTEKVFEKTGAGQDTREQIINKIDSIEDQSPESIEKEILGASSKEDKEGEGFKTTASSMKTEKQNKEECATPRVSLLSVGEETATESSNGGESDAIKLKEEVKESYLEFIQQTEARSFMDETKSEVLKDRENINKDLEEEMPPKETNENLVEHSLVSEASEKENKTETSEKEESTVNDSDSALVTIVTDEKCLRDAETEDKKQNLESDDLGKKLECTSESVAEDQRNKPLPEISQTQIEEDNDGGQDQTIESVANESIKDVILTEKVFETTGAGQDTREQIINKIDSIEDQSPESIEKEILGASSKEDKEGEGFKTTASSMNTEKQNKEECATPRVSLLSVGEETATESSNGGESDAIKLKEEVKESYLEFIQQTEARSFMDETKSEVLKDRDNINKDLEEEMPPKETNENLVEHSLLSEASEKENKTETSEKEESTVDDSDSALVTIVTDEKCLRDAETEDKKQNLESDDLGKKLECTSESVAEDQSNKPLPAISQTQIEEDNNEGQDQTIESVANESIKDAILTGKVPEGSEKGDENENIKERIIQKESATKELHTASSIDEADVEGKNSDPVSIDNLKPTDSNEQIETMNLEVEEDLDREQEASPLTKASEKETMEQVGKEKTADVSISVSEVSEEKIKEEIKEQAVNYYDKLETTSVNTVTMEKSLGEPQPDDKWGKALNNSLQEALNDEAILDLGCSNKILDGLPTTHSFNEEILLEVGEKCEEASNLQLDETEKALESASKVQSHEILTESEETEIKEEHHEAAKAELRAEENQSEKCEEASNLQLDETEKALESAYKVQSDEILTESEETEIKEKHHEAVTAELRAEENRSEKCEEASNLQLDEKEKALEPASKVQSDEILTESKETEIKEENHEAATAELRDEENQSEKREEASKLELDKTEKALECASEVQSRETFTESEETKIKELHHEVAPAELRAEENQSEKCEEASNLELDKTEKALEFASEVQSDETLTKSEETEIKEEHHEAATVELRAKENQSEKCEETSNLQLNEPEKALESAFEVQSREILSESEETEIKEEHHEAAMAELRAEENQSEKCEEASNLQLNEPEKALESASEVQSREILTESEKTEIKEEHHEAAMVELKAEENQSEKCEEASNLQLDETEKALESASKVQSREILTESEETEIKEEHYEATTAKLRAEENPSEKCEEASNLQLDETEKALESATEVQSNETLTKSEETEIKEEHHKAATAELRAEENQSEKCEEASNVKLDKTEKALQSPSEVQSSEILTESKVTKIKEEHHDAATAELRAEEKQSKKCEEASNLELDKTEKALESESEVQSDEILTESEETAIKEEHHEPTMAELRAEENWSEKCEEASNLGLDKTEKALESASKVQSDEIFTKSQEIGIKEEHHEATTAELSAEENQTEANEIVKNEVSNEELSNEIEKTSASRNIIKQTTHEDRALGDPYLVSVGDETLKESFPDEAEEKNVEEAEIKLNLENQGDTTNFRDSKTAATTLSEEVIIELEKHDLDTLGTDDKKETAITKIEEGPNTNLGVPPDTNAAAEEAPHERVGDESEKASEPYPAELVHETNIIHKEDEEISTAVADNQESIMEDQKQEHTSLALSRDGTNVKEDLKLKGEEVYDIKSGTSCANKISQEEIPDKNSTITEDEKQHDLVFDKETAAELGIPAEGKGIKDEREHAKNEEPKEVSTRENESKPDEVEIHSTCANEDREIQYQSQKPDDLAHIQDSGLVMSPKEGSVVLAEAIVTSQDVPTLEKNSPSISEKQILRETDPSEITETMVSTGNKDALLVVQDPEGKTSQKAEVKGLEPENASEIELESTPMDAAKISLSNLQQRSTKETLQTAGQVTEEKEPMSNKELQTEEVETLQVEATKTNKEKDEEEEGDEHKKEDSGSDTPIMVEASRDMDVKVSHKKSHHNILSGVGSKVKHSIAKVKKAITGKSSHPKPISPK